jgi:hypothetical protein
MEPRQVAAENLDGLYDYSEDTWKRIYKYATRAAVPCTDRQIRKEMITLMVNMGFTTQMPGHGTSKKGKSSGLQHATKVWLKNVADELDSRNIY